MFIVKYVLRLSSPTRNTCATMTPEKPPTFSRFLQGRNEKASKETKVQAADMSLLTSPGNHR